MFAIGPTSSLLFPLLLAPPSSCTNATGCQIEVVDGECVATPSAGDVISINKADNVRLSRILVGNESQPEVVPKDGFWSFPFKAGVWKIELNDGDAVVTCDEFELKPITESTSSPRADDFDPDMAELATRAGEWLETKGTSKHETTTVPGWSRRIKLYYLPDGRPAFPIPDDIEETDILIIAVVVPRGSGVDVVTSSCPDLQLGRVRGSVAEVTSLIMGKADGAERSMKPIAGWMILESGEFRCSENLKVTLHVHSIVDTVDSNEPKASEGKTTKTVLSASEEIRIPLDEVFFLTVGVGLVFDLGRPTVTSLRDRPSAAMPMVPEKYVAQSNNFTGLRPVITVGAHPCGANPRRWRACDVFSPTLVLDPTRIREGFGLGLNLTAPWFGVILAANMYKSQVLGGGTNIMVGDTWTAPGDVPGSKVFDRRSFGAFIGVSLTTDLFHAVVGAKK